MEASSLIPISSYLETLPVEAQRYLSSFLRTHPRAYLQEAQGLRSGIVRYHEWRVISPDEKYRMLGVGKTKEEAFQMAYDIWDGERRLDAAKEGF
jgi:hypothetical protein